MLEKLFILILWPDRYSPTLLNLAASIFAGLTLVGAKNQHKSSVKWLLPLTAGFSLEASSSILRMGVEVITNRSRLPGWFVDIDHNAYLLGQFLLIAALFILWRSMSNKHYNEVQAQNTAVSESWPPAPRP